MSEELPEEILNQVRESIQESLTKDYERDGTPDDKQIVKAEEMPNWLVQFMVDIVAGGCEGQSRTLTEKQGEQGKEWVEKMMERNQYNDLEL